jgi:hypothetical protein
MADATLANANADAPTGNPAPLYRHSDSDLTKFGDMDDSEIRESISRRASQVKGLAGMVYAADRGTFTEDDLQGAMWLIAERMDEVQDLLTGPRRRTEEAAARARARATASEDQEKVLFRMRDRIDDLLGILAVASASPAS